MSDLVDQNRFAPPRAQLAEPASLAEGPVPAGRGMRFVSVILDGLLMSLIAYPLFFVFGGSSMFVNPDPAMVRDPFALMRAMFAAMVPGYIVVILIQAWCLHAYGGTAAKKILGLRIVRTDGSRAGFVRLFFGRGAVATLPACIPLLGSLWMLIDSLMIFRQSRQCLHDQIADTVVVTAASSTNASLAAQRAR
jgi:uncharacterized RDD family membrane protein YckC